MHWTPRPRQIIEFRSKDGIWAVGRVVEGGVAGNADFCTVRPLGKKDHLSVGRADLRVVRKPMGGFGNFGGRG